MKIEDMARQAYITTHEDAPPDVPIWQELHEVERKFLIDFTEVIIKDAAVAEDFEQQQEEDTGWPGSEYFDDIPIKRGDG